MTSKDETFEPIFQGCLERVCRGEALQSILERYPAQAVELRAPLETAAWLMNRRPALAPRPGFVQASQRRMTARLRLARQRRPALAWAYSPLMPGVRLTLALLVVAALLLNGVSIACAAPTWLPGDPLYGLRMVGESASLTVTPGLAGNARLHIEFARHRLLEIEALTIEERLDYLPSTVDAFVSHAQQAQTKIQLFTTLHQPQGRQLAGELRQVLAGQIELLRLLSIASPGNSQQLQRALVATQAGIAAMDQILGLSSQRFQPMAITILSDGRPELHNTLQICKVLPRWTL